MTPVVSDNRSEALRSPASRKVLEALPEAASLLLDAIRFTLALLVVVGHVTLPWFSVSWPPLLGWADVAVPGFFVLSGFMIRYVTQDRERDPRRYFISRVSRLYSVLLPAIVVTLVCRGIVAWRNPGYAAWLWQPESTAALLGHLAAHLFFFTQFWGHAVLLPPNIPLWSLGYEVPYYVLFGLLALCRGAWRWFAAALYAVALGPQVLFLAPLWWSGCWLYDLWQWSRRRGLRAPMFAAASGAALLLLLPIGGAAVWTRIASIRSPLMIIGQPMARATMLAYASGLVSWVLMLLGLCASDWFPVRRNTRWARPVRRVAEGTFALYLLHYPLLCLVPAFHGRVLTDTWTTAALTFAVVVVCVVASAPIDALKTWMRRTLSAKLPGQSSDPASAAQSRLAT